MGEEAPLLFSSHACTPPRNSSLHPKQTGPCYAGYFSPLLKNRKFQIPIRSAMGDKELLCGYATIVIYLVSYLFIITTNAFFVFFQFIEFHDSWAAYRHPPCVEFLIRDRNFSPSTSVCVVDVFQEGHDVETVAVSVSTRPRKVGQHSALSG